MTMIIWNSFTTVVSAASAYFQPVLNAHETYLDLILRQWYA